MKLFLSLLFFAALHSEAYFIPPKDWQVADPAQLSPSVKASFLTKGKKEYCPSMNIASEKVVISLDEYMKAVKEAHCRDKNNQWRDLGKFTCMAGEGRLCEIETKTPLGVARLIQFILVKEGTAYVVTGSALKEEFAAHLKEFQKAFHSFSISDLFEKKEALKKEVDAILAAWQKRETRLESGPNNNVDEDFQKRYLLPFQKKVLEEFTEMGSYWQILMLQFVQKKLI